MIMVIDGNNLAHRVFHTPQGSLTTKQGEPSGVLLGVLNAIRQNLQRFPETTKVIVCWDAKGSTNWRKEVYPDYKGNRDYGKDDEVKKEAYQGLWDQLEECNRMLHMVGVHSVKVNGMEADDLMAYIANQASKHVMIITSDKDMLQLVSDKVSIYSPYRDKVISPLDFYEETGVTKEAYIGYRALVGDKSDNIIGIDGIGEKKAKSLMDTYGHIDNILNAQGEDKKKLVKSKVFSRIFTPEGMNRLALNNKIMSFKHVPYNQEAVDLIEGALRGTSLEFSSKAFRAWIVRWQFVSILADYLTWASPFMALGDEE
jgi:DNA polymerase-1